MDQESLNKNTQNNLDEDNEENIEEKIEKKKIRKKNAIKLPEGITQDMLKIYVVYYKEINNKEKGLTREYFKVEKHPKLKKPYITSKSNKVSILEKLKNANEYIENLKNQ